jgi:hypothetical protein
LWPHLTSGDHNLYKLESAISKELLCKSELFWQCGSWEKNLWMTPPYFCIFVIISPFLDYLPFEEICTILNSLYQRMICTKFNWNSLVGSGVEDSKLYVSSMPRMPPHSAKVLKPCLIFSNFKGDNCQKSLDCNFNLVKVKEWKLKISYFLVISGGITLSKSMDHNQIRTWPAHSYDISTRAISTLYMNPNKS